MSNSIERAYKLTNAKSRADLARILSVSPSSVQGYEARGTLPLEQCAKLAEQTGVSLDWLILGKEASEAQTVPLLNPEQQMLLTGFDSLNAAQQDCIFNLIRRLTRGETMQQAVQHLVEKE